MTDKIIQVKINKDVLNKLKWIHQANDDEKLILCALQSYVRRMEELEGTTYPTDYLPENAFNSIDFID